MSGQCGQCPALQAQVNSLRATMAALQQRIWWLEARLALLQGVIVSTVALLRKESEETTMPYIKLLGLVWGRLENARAEIEGS